MGYDDYGWAAGLGVGMFAIMAILYLGIMALSIWVTYLIIRTAVKNGILKADEERIRRGYSAAPQPRGYANPSAPGTYPPQR